MPGLGQTADSPCPARDGTLEAVWKVGWKKCVNGVQGTCPLPAGGISYLGVMAFLVLAVGMAVAGSSGQGCLG